MQAVYVDVSPSLAGEKKPMIFLLDDLNNTAVTEHLMMPDLDGSIAHMKFKSEGKTGFILCDAHAHVMARYLKTDNGRVRCGSSFIVLWDEPIVDPVASVNYLLDLSQ